MKRFYNKLDDNKLTIDREFKRSLQTRLIKLENKMAKPKSNNKLTRQFNRSAFQGALIIAIIFTATASTIAWQAKKDVKSRQETIEDNLQLPENLGDVLSLEDIRKLATIDTPSGATITQIELENEEGSVVYKVKFSDGSYRLYDAKTGLAFNKVEAIEVDSTVPAGFVAGISIQEARDIAAARRPGQTVIKIELETEEGVVVYSVRFGDGSRVDVNANDGNVLRVRTSTTETQRSSDSDDSNSSSDDSSGSGSGSSSGGSESSNDDSNDDEDSSGHDSNSGSGSSNDD